MDFSDLSRSCRDEIPWFLVWNSQSSLYFHPFLWWWTPTDAFFGGLMLKPPTAGIGMYSTDEEATVVSENFGGIRWAALWAVVTLDIQRLWAWTMLTGWWFGTFFIFPYIGNNRPIWLIFFRGVETTNQLSSTGWVSPIFSNHLLISPSLEWSGKEAPSSCVCLPKFGSLAFPVMAMDSGFYPYTILW